MRRLLFGFVILASFAALAGCGREYFLFFDPAHPWAKYVREVSASDHSISVSPGTLVRVHLPGNGGADYRWALVSDTPCRAVAFSDSERIPAELLTPPGASDVEIWSFRAVQPGRDVLDFGYCPPDRPIPVKTRHLTIIVQD